MPEIPARLKAFRGQARQSRAAEAGPAQWDGAIPLGQCASDQLESGQVATGTVWLVKVEETGLPGVIMVTPRRFADDRGFFCEVYNRRAFAEAGIDCDFVQDNQSRSRQVGVVRGLHYQAPPRAQAKLVRVGGGRVLDVAVDVRRGSSTYGRWTAVELSAAAGNQLFIPAGFLHGFAVLEPDTEVLYKCSDFYAPDCDGAVRFDDPDIGIDWRLDPADVILSDKDARAPRLRDFYSPFVHTSQG